MLIAFGVLTGSIASAQTAHMSQYQTVLNIPSPIENAYGMAVDSSGNIYIADQDNRRVLKLTPSTGGFIQSTIGTGLGLPYGIAVDAGGNVYIADIQLSTLLKETPNGSGGYTQSTIGSELFDAVSVAVDKHGNVFGVANGELFKEGLLGGGAYTQSYLPTPGSHGVYQVVVDGNGDLFLNDSYDNEVFEDVPLPGGGYATTQIPGAANSLAVDSNNNLYEAYYPGALEAGNSYISKLTPNGSGGFTSTFIPADASFNDGDYYGINYYVDYFIAYGLSVDGNGNVFFIDGYTEELIEESTSPANAGQVPVTGSSYPVAMFLTFDTPGIMEGYSIVTGGTPNLDFIDSYYGSCIPPGNYPVGYTCDIDVYFTPTAPGPRFGAVVLNDNNGNPFFTGYVQGIGTSPLVDFPGAAPAPLITGLYEPLGITVDESGNVIVANSGNQNVLVTPPGGTQSPVGSGFNNPTGVAEDGAGNIFVAQNGIVYEIAKATGVQTQVTLSGVSDPNDLAIDGAGNLYISEPNLGKVVKVTPAGVETSVGAGLSGPRGIAVDAGGNVYIADYTSGNVYVVAPSGAQSTISGFGGPSGVAVDAAGNVYVAVYGNGELVEVSPGGTRTVVASGLSDPYSVALDGNGNIYFSDYASGDVRKIDRMDAPSLNFATTLIGSTSSDSPRTVTLSNNGNAALLFQPPASGNNPTITTNFTLNSSEPSACPLVTSSSSQPGTLATGASCLLPVSFTPETGGLLSGLLTITDTNLNAPSPNYAVQTIQLSGTATSSSPAITSVSPILPQQTQTISITGSGFGTHAPFTGDLSYILFADPTGTPWYAGYTGDSVTLSVSSWTDSEIVLTGFTGSYGTDGQCIKPGDQLYVKVWNAQTGVGPAYYPITAGSGTNTCVAGPAIASVSPILPQQTQTITITGSGFGTQSPYNGDSSHILFADPTGTPWYGGYTGDSVNLSVSSWTDSQIVITGFTGAYGTNAQCIKPGDQLYFKVWNAQSGSGPAYYPITAGSGANTCDLVPTITTVSPILPQQTQTITISGFGFGTQAPYNGDSSHILFADPTGTPWYAGDTGDAVTLSVSSWSDTQIVLTGFTGAYGTDGMCIKPGDQLYIKVWNVQSGNGPAFYPITAGSGTNTCVPGPAIASVSPILPQQTQTITITGSGFGTQSPYNGDSSHILFADPTGTPWYGGYPGDSVTLSVSSWTDSQIVITGFTGSYGTSAGCIKPGDQLYVKVWNAQTNSGPAYYQLTAGSGANTCP
jgi:sugar lactone lactonase YvrE/protein involved in polysaccharide export with SLBB domain